MLPPRIAKVLPGKRSRPFPWPGDPHPTDSQFVDLPTVPPVGELRLVLFERPAEKPEAAWLLRAFYRHNPYDDWIAHSWVRWTTRAGLKGRDQMLGYPAFPHPPAERDWDEISPESYWPPNVAEIFILQDERTISDP